MLPPLPRAAIKVVCSALALARGAGHPRRDRVLLAHPRCGRADERPGLADQPGARPDRQRRDGAVHLRDGPQDGGLRVLRDQADDWVFRTMERSGMGCSSLICRALAGAAWSPSKVGRYKSINIRSHPPQRTPRSRTVEKIIAFAICLLTKIDASRFSGSEKSRGVHFLRQM